MLDVRLPGQSGLDFQRMLADSGIELPLVFITGHGDVPMSVQAMKAGAVEFLLKAFRDQDLLDAVQAAIEPIAIAAKMTRLPVTYGNASHYSRTRARSFGNGRCRPAPTTRSPLISG